MAGEEQATVEFTQILTKLQRKFEIIHVKWTDDKLFEIKFRTQIQRNSDDFNALCDEWVDLFSEHTNTVWVKKISNTGPKIRFRKQYQCWTREGKVVQKELLFDARRCRATLDMKVLTDNPQTRRKNKHIKLGLNVVVKINFTHLHQVDFNKPMAFFVHTCDPLPEAPKPAVHSNENLPKLIADMVQKGLKASPKIINLNPPATEQPTIPFSQSNNIMNEQNAHHVNLASLDLNMVKPIHSHQESQNVVSEIHMNHHAQMNAKILNNELIQVQNFDAMHLSQVLPLQNIDGLKMNLGPQMQQLTQVVVSSPQLDINDSLLCQSTVMFDSSQIIPVNQHFVQVESESIPNQQDHYL